jgi:hypothetical protein
MSAKVISINSHPLQAVDSEENVLGLFPDNVIMSTLVFVSTHPSKGPKAKKDADPSLIKIFFSRFSWECFGVPQRKFITYCPLQKFQILPSVINDSIES